MFWRLIICIYILKDFLNSAFLNSFLKKFRFYEFYCIMEPFYPTSITTPMELIIWSTHFGKCYSDRRISWKNKRNNTFTLILTDVFDLTIFNKEFQDHAGPQFTFRSYRTTNIFICSSNNVMLGKARSFVIGREMRGWFSWGSELGYMWAGVQVIRC